VYFGQASDRRREVDGKLENIVRETASLLTEQQAAARRDVSNLGDTLTTKIEVSYL